MERRCTVLALSVALSLLATWTDTAGQREGRGDDCIPLSVAVDRRNAERAAGTRSGTPSAGFHGMIYGGEWVMENGAIRLAGSLEVQQVICNSPADRADVRAGDVILSVNGGDPSAPGALAARRPGMRFDLRIRRRERVLEVSFVSVSRPPELTT